MAGIPAFARAPAPIGEHTPGWRSAYLETDLAAWYVPPPATTWLIEPPSWTTCSCVEAAKWATGNQVTSWGFAGNIIPNADRPIVGGFGLTTEASGHLFVIASVSDDGLWVHAIEWNWSPCQRSEREVRVDDPIMRGWVKQTGPDPI